MSTSRIFSLIGLLLLALIVPWWLNVSEVNLSLLAKLAFGSTPPALLAVATYKRTRNWSGITGLCMIPYAAMGMMDIVASSGAMLSGLALGTASIAIFFLVLDAGRREP